MIHAHMVALPYWGWLAAGFLLGVLLAVLAGRLKHQHQWEPVQSQVTVVPLAPLTGESGHTVVLWGCARRRCTALDTTRLEGRWTWDDVRGHGGVPTVPNHFEEVR